MSLLDIVQRVCDEVGLPRPAFVVSPTNDQLPRQMFSLANAELEELSKRFDWPQLVREYSFDTVADQEAYALPDDCRKVISNALYAVPREYEVRGSMPPTQWQHMRAAQILGNTGCTEGFRIYGTPLKLHVLPVPTDVGQLAFEYMSSNFAAAQDGTPKPRFSNDADEPVLDEGLIRMGLKWRIKHAKGLEFSADLAEYESTVAREFANAMASPVVPVGFRRRVSEDAITCGNIPTSGFGV